MSAETRRDGLIAARWIAGLIAAGVLVNAIALTRHAHGAERRHAAGREAPQACLPASLRQAIARLRQACDGLVVLSTYRRGAVIAGTHHASMHASCRAVDFRVARWACAYRVLADWPGKLSVDAARMRHIHIDTGRFARFVHGGGRHGRKRFAATETAE